ncbi:hypothetical protein Tco_0743424, partial [Tanacetum coccineum]
MADMNIPANDVHAEQAPAITPPTRTDDQSLTPFATWETVTVGKSNLRARCTEVTMHYDSTTGIYSGRLDEQWFNLYKDILRDALLITPIDDNNPFVAPPSSDAVIDYVNTLGYPSPYYDGYLAYVAEYQRYLDGEHGMAEEEAVPESPAPKATKVTKPKAAMQTKPSASKAPKVTKPAGDKAPKPTSSQPPKPTPAPTKSSKEVQGKKRKLVKETSNAPSPAKRSKASKVTKKRKSKSPLRLVDEVFDEGVPDKEPAYNDEEANFQRA